MTATVGAKVRMIDDAADSGVLTVIKVEGSRLEVRDESGDWGVVRTWDVEPAGDDE